MIFWKKTLTVFLGVFFAQLISILGSVAITAICLPEQFGYFSSWLGIVSILAVGFTLRFEALFVVVDDPEKRKEFVENTIWVTSFISVLAIPIVFIIGMVFIDDKGYFVKVTSSTIAALLLSLNLILQSWAAARGDYPKLNILRVVYASSTILSQILFGFIFRTGVSLLVGFSAGLVVAVICSFVLSPKLNWIPRWHQKNRVLNFVKSYKRFPLFSLPADLISTLTASLPIILTFDKFGAEKSGYLALTVRLLAGPLGLFGKAVLDVFKKEASIQYESKKDCHKIYAQTFFVLAFFSLLFFAFAYMLIDFVILFMYGPNWAMSARIGKALLALFCFQLIASPLSYVVYIVQKQHFDLLWQAGLLIVTFCSFYFASDFWSALQIYCECAVVMYLVYICVNYKFSFGKRE